MLRLTPSVAAVAFIISGAERMQKDPLLRAGTSEALSNLPIYYSTKIGLLSRYNRIS